MMILATYAVTLCLLIGAVFTLVGAIGLLRFTDPMARMHAPTKVGTIGIGAFLLASMIHSFAYSDGSLHEMLIMGFLFVTAPISAVFIAKVHIHKNTCKTPPSPPRDGTWATLNVPPEDREYVEQKEV